MCQVPPLPQCGALEQNSLAQPQVLLLLLLLPLLSLSSSALSLELPASAWAAGSSGQQQTMCHYAHVIGLCLDATGCFAAAGNSRTLATCRGSGCYRLLVLLPPTLEWASTSLLQRKDSLRLAPGSAQAGNLDCPSVAAANINSVT